MRKKKSKKETEALGITGGEVLQPIAAYTPLPGLPSATNVAQSTQLTQPQVFQARPMVSAGTTAQPAAQLPPAIITTQAPVQMDPTAEMQKHGIDSGLTPQQKIKLLEERLLHGEIDQDIYLNLKAKFEMEAKPYTMAPQLPPATTTITTTPTQAPTPTPPVSPPPSVTVAQPQPQQAPPSMQPTITASVSEPQAHTQMPTYRQPQPAPPQQQTQPQQVPQPQLQQPEQQQDQSNKSAELEQ